MKSIYLTILLLSFQTLIFSQSHEEELYIKSIVDIDNGKINDAILLIKEAVELNNTDNKLYMILGDCYKKKKNHEFAIENYKKAMKLKNNFASYKIAECYSLKDDPQKSIEYLREYLKTKNKLFESDIKLNPSFKNIENTNDWINLWKFEHYNNYEKKLSEAKFLISIEKFSDAFEILDDLLIRNNKRYRAIEMRADLLMLTNDYKSAAKEYTKAANIKKNDVNYKIKAANAYFKNKKFSKALQFYNEAIKKQTYNIQVYKKKAETELLLKKYENVQNSINYFLKFYPNNSEARYISGKTYINTNEPISALEQLNICLLNDHSKPIYFIERADIYITSGLYENAIYDYSMALDINPKLAEVYFKRGIAKLNIFEYKAACSDFKKAKSLNHHKADDYLLKHCK